MKGYKARELAETIGYALMDFSKTGEKARMERRIRIAKNNYDRRTYAWLFGRLWR